MTQLSPSRRQVLYSLLLLCTVAPLLFLLQTDRSVSVFDGSMVPLLSYRVLLGQVPHRDFYNCYGPLPFLLQAACYKLFGVSLWVAYLLNTAGRTLTLAIAYLVVRRVGTQTMAVAVAVAFYLLLSPSSVPSVATAASRFLILGAALSATAFLRARRPLDGLLVGLVAGLITLYRYEQGVVVLLVEAVTLGAASMVWTGSWRSRLRAVAASMGAALCGYALLAGAMVLVFARLHALGDLIQQMNFLRLHNPAGRRLPFTLPLLHHPEQNLILLPLLAAPLGIVVVTVWLARRRRIADRLSAGMVCAFSVLALGMAVKGSVRVDVSQMLPAILASVVVLAVLLGSQLPPRWLRWATVVLAVGASLGMVRLWEKEAHRLQHEHMSLLQHWAGEQAVPDEAAWCAQHSPVTQPVCFLPDADHRQAIAWLLPHVTAGERMYVGLPQHDVIFANDHLTYFGTETLPAVKWEMFEPDLQNSLPVQQSMVQDLQRYKPHFSVADGEFSAVHEPNRSSVSSGVHLLDEYLRANYMAAAEFGELTITERR